MQPTASGLSRWQEIMKANDQSPVHGRATVK
jgi:hypothetical protein